MKIGMYSPLGHEIGLPLFYLFNQGAGKDNDNNDGTTPIYFYRPTMNAAAYADTDDASNKKDIVIIPSHLESIFQRCLLKCYGAFSSNNFISECGCKNPIKPVQNVYESLEHITKHLCTEFDELIQGKILCTRQNIVQKYRRKSPLMVDMMLSTPSNVTSSVPSSSNANESILETRPLAIYQIGVRVKDWWRRLESGGEAVQEIMKSTDFVCGRPLLLFVLKYDIRKQRTNRRSSDMSSNEVTDKEIIEDWLLGVFLCWKTGPDTKAKDEHIYHTSLLWRAEGDSLLSLSVAFGKTIYATQQLAYWRNHKDERYMYLGPHCCRFTRPDGQQVRLKKRLVSLSFFLNRRVLCYFYHS
jgi:hypothetical protein